MSNLFGMYSTTTRAMQTQSFMISTASHNIANAETEGYSRQRVDLSAAEPVTYRGIGQLGMGVDIEAIKRLRDSFLDVQIRYETSIQSKFTTAQASLDQVETIFKEPSETGLVSAMNDMWNSWSELVSRPEGTTQRSVVAQRADDLAKNMNHMYEQLETLNNNTVTQVESDVYDANTIIDQLQDTVSQIYAIKIQGLEPNDLLDRRDLLLEKLSKVVNINVQEDQFGRLRITEADSGENYELMNYSKDTPPEHYMSVVRTAKYDNGNWTLTVVNGGDISDVQEVTFTAGDGSDPNLFKAGDVLMCYTGEDLDQPNFEGPYRPNLGSIAGAQMAIEKVEGYMGNLDNLAYTIASSINTVHGKVTAGSGVETDFFTVTSASDTLTGFPDVTDSAKGAAKYIKVSDEIMNDVSLIQTGHDGTSSSQGDVSRAKAIAQLADVKFAIYDIEALNEQLGEYTEDDMKIPNYTGGSSTSGYYQDLIGKIGIDSQSAQRNIENQKTLVLQLREKQASTSGVSIDEEVASLMQFQTAYQANARVINTITTMLDTLIGLTK